MHNIRKSNAPPLVRGKPVSGQKARSPIAGGWQLLYPKSNCPDRGRDDPDYGPDRQTQFVNKTSVALCEVSALSAVKQKTKIGKQYFAGQHRALLNKGNPHALHGRWTLAGGRCFGLECSVAFGSTSYWAKSKDVVKNDEFSALLCGNFANSAVKKNKPQRTPGRRSEHRENANKWLLTNTK